MECVWPVGALLGEGPIWVEREQALWFTDIKGRTVNRFDPVSGERKSYNAPAQPGFMLPSADGKFIAGLQGGLYRFDPEDGSYTLMIAVEPELPGNRLNDAVVDPTGHLWFGSMDDVERAECGRFYRLDDDGIARPRGLGCAITNGPAFSPDGGIGYFVDTLAKQIWAYDIDEQGALSGQRLFAEIEQGAGYPDGPSVDADGNVWVGLYDGWAARRYSPDGNLVESVAFPVANITKVVCGGTDGRTAFATSAAKQLSAAEIERQPLAGGLFSFAVAVPGLQSFEIKHGI